MKIDCEMNDAEFDWWLDMHKKLKKAGYKVERVYRDDEGLSIQLKAIVLSKKTETIGECNE